MSYKFAKSLAVEPEPLRQTLIVETPSKQILKAHVVYKAFKVMVSRREFTVYLILLDLTGFEIILGIDWLEAYCAVIDCGDKTITLHPPKKGITL